MKFVRTIVLIACLAGIAIGQDQPVPPELQIELLQKLLQFNRTIASKQPLVIGVAFQSPFRSSLLTKDALLAAGTRYGTSLRLVPIDIGDGSSVADIISNRSIDVLYIAPLRAFPIESILKQTRDSHVLTVTGVPEYVELGVTVGIGVRNNRPEIIINLGAMKEEAGLIDVLARMKKSTQ